MHTSVHLTVYSVLNGHTTHHWASCPTDVATGSVTEATHTFLLCCRCVGLGCRRAVGGCTMYLLHSVGYTVLYVRTCALSVVPCVLLRTSLRSHLLSWVSVSCSSTGDLLYVLAVGIAWGSGICAAVSMCTREAGLIRGPTTMRIVPIS